MPGQSLVTNSSASATLGPVTSINGITTITVNLVGTEIRELFPRCYNYALLPLHIIYEHYQCTGLMIWTLLPIQTLI